MIIKTKYDLQAPIYIITKRNKNYFYVDKRIYRIIGISYYSEAILNYQVWDGYDYSIDIPEHKIDDLDNGYYFSSLELAEKACEIANKRHDFK